MSRLGREQERQEGGGQSDKGPDIPDARQPDFKHAKWAEGVVAVAGLFAQRVMVDQLRIPPSRAAACMRKYAALQVFPNEAEWRLVGWPGLGKLAELPEHQREGALEEIRSLAATRADGRVSDSSVNAVLRRYLGDPLR